MRKVVKIGGVVIFAVFVVVTLAFTSVKYNNVACSNIEVNYYPDDVIKIDKDILTNLVRSVDKNIIGKKFSKINAVKIEKAVESHDAVLSAEVYKVVTHSDSSLFTGVLSVKVKHRTPVVRVISGNKSYFLDEFGGVIPVSSKYPANVLVANGKISEKYAKEKLLPFVLFLKNDEFWAAQIEQIYVKKNGEILLTPLIGDHLVELGLLNNYREKLRNMKAFYEKVLANGNWNKYKTISIKYKNQVIAKRR